MLLSSWVILTTSLSIAHASPARGTVVPAVAIVAPVLADTSFLTDTAAQTIPMTMENVEKAFAVLKKINTIPKLDSLTKAHHLPPWPYDGFALQQANGRAFSQDSLDKIARHQAEHFVAILKLPEAKAAFEGAGVTPDQVGWIQQKLTLVMMLANGAKSMFKSMPAEQGMGVLFPFPVAAGKQDISFVCQNLRELNKMMGDLGKSGM